MILRRSLVAAGGLLLLAATVVAFEAFDRHSHSASDTLRPFVLTMAPLWVLGIAGAALVLRDR